MTFTPNPDWLADAVFDLETSGLLDTVTKTHCAVIIDRHTGERLRYRPDEIPQFLLKMQALADTGYRLAAHNGIKYDAAVIKKLYDMAPAARRNMVDTMVLARVVHPDLKAEDANRYKAWMPKSRKPSKRRKLAKKAQRTGNLPAALWGSHKLKAWGIRLGVLKGDYGEQEDAWDVFSEDMLDYCVQDCEVTLRLLEHLEKRKLSPVCATLELDTAWLIAQQERNGFPFDEHKARELYIRLVQDRTVAENRLLEWFPPWQVRLKDFIPKRDNKRLGYTAGVPVPKYAERVFNPASRDHIADRLIKLFGWKPTQLTNTGKPVVDEETLRGLPYPPVPDLIQYLLIQKRIGQLAEGDNAWLKLVKKGKIHGSVNTGGTVGGRASHSYPNVGQVPATSSPYGAECRELFNAGQWPYLVGCDTSGLELRCLAHYMHPWDGGAYADLVVNGDVHTENQKAAGLPTRNNAKTFIYAWLYGGGDEKIGEIVGGTRREGKQLKERFIRAVPAVGKLRTAVEKKAAKTGFLTGLDGRRLPVRSAHSALNLLLQSAGAVICKMWLVEIEDILAAQGLRHGWDGDYCQVAWVHDEAEWACRTEAVRDAVTAASLEAIKRVGERLAFRCPLAAEAKQGYTWKDVH